MTVFRDTEKEKGAPAEKTAAQVAAKHLKGVRRARRVPEGVSTYVYRVETDRGVFYQRFLPEDATFGAEALAQKKLGELGVLVPKVRCYEAREPVTGYSMMITEALLGEALSPRTSKEVLRPVLQEAGRQLKLLHTVPVAGFGWVDRRFETEFRGKSPDFYSCFDEFLESDLCALAAFLPKGEMEQLRALTEEARKTLDTGSAALVHGDFCMEHIFHTGDTFTGFIDFGEIRGHHPYFDLGTFANSDETEGNAAARWLFEGYGEVDVRAVHLSALCFALRFAGKKAALPAGEFWRERLNKELIWLSSMEP